MSNEQPKIYEAICNIMAEVEAIGKNNKNKTQNWMFRGIDDVYNKCHPLFAKHKVFSTSEILSSTMSEKTSQKGGILFYKTLTIKYRFYAVDGSFVETQVEGLAMDSGDKSANKAMAVGHKYAIVQMLFIPTQDGLDPDAETHNTVLTVEEKKKRILCWINKMQNKDIKESWLKWYNKPADDIMINSEYNKNKTKIEAV